MSAGSYAIGVLSVLVVVGSIAIIAIRLRVVLVPTWRGAVARLVELVIGHAALLLLAEALGTAHILRRGVMVPVAAVLAAVVWALTAGRSANPEEKPARERLVPLLFALVAVSFVGAQWLSARSTASAGIQGVDANHYHLTFAAHFAQSHATTHFYHVSAIDPTAYYPLNDELLHGVWMLLLGADALSLFVGLISMAAALIASWCLGAPYRMGSACVVAACIALSLSGRDYLTGAGNDWAAIWTLMTAVVLVDKTRRDGGLATTRLMILVGLCAGLAVGTKLNALAPGGLLCLLAGIFYVREHRVRNTALALSGALLGGGYWYARDVIYVHNPIPETPVHLGPISLPRPPMPVLDSGSFSVLHYITDTSVIRHYFHPAVALVLGPVWFLLVLAGAVGLVWSLWRPLVPSHRLASILAIAAFVAYLSTPTGAGGTPGHPDLFVFNIRYGMLALILGLVLTTLLPWVRDHPEIASGALLVLLAITVLRRAQFASGWPRSAAVTIVVLVVVGAVALRASGRQRLTAALLLAVVAIIAAKAPLDTYLRKRYRVGSDPQQQIYASMQDVRHSQVGIVGLPLQYPFFGPGLTNHVRYVGQLAKDKGFSDYTECGAFTDATHGLDYLVVQPFRDSQALPLPLTWLAANPDAKVVFSGKAGNVYRLVAPLQPSSCPPSPSPAGRPPASATQLQNG